ncbi:unnamed protein product [Oikopleura dioica]|uniref:Uncharacterized protein n=1 Tax=Oikopleura dioica TaxID=34765 RepID=E4X230_OIKDI|nr:unnamed protein product [Oikopleura dioica]
MPADSPWQRDTKSTTARSEATKKEMQRQTEAYRRLIKDEDYFFRLKEEVDSARDPDKVRYDFKVLTSEDDDDTEMAKIWCQKATADGSMMERNARPCSPDFKPTQPEDIRDSPKQPLTDKPNYASALNIVPLGPQEQYAVYFDKNDLETRSRKYCRIGEPGFIQEYRARATKLGSTCPSFFNSMYGRLHIVEYLASLEGVNWTTEERALLIAGLDSVLESLNPSSKHFRSDLLAVFEGNHSKNGDSAVGYMGLVALHDGIRTFKRKGVTVRESTTRRVQDILYSVSEFRKVFPEFKQRTNVRRLLGTTRYDFPGTSCLLTYEDAYFVSQRLSILPKNERRCFILELYLEGKCIGTLCFIGTQHQITLQPGEYALTESEYGLEPKTRHERKGPAQRERQRKEALDQEPTTESLREHKRLHQEAMTRNSEAIAFQEALNQEEKSLNLAFKNRPSTKPSEAEKILLGQYFQTQIEEEIYRRVVENESFLDQMRRISEWSKAAVAEARRKRASVDCPLLQPEAETQKALDERTLAYNRAVQEFQASVLRDRPDYQVNLAQLQAELTALSLVPSYSIVDQFWTVLRRSCERILGCEACKGRHGILQRRCDCLRVWLQTREDQEDRDDDGRPHWDRGFVACFKCREYNEELGQQELPEDYLLSVNKPLCKCMETWLGVFAAEKEPFDFCQTCAAPATKCKHPSPLPRQLSRPGQYGYEIQEASSDKVSVAGQPDLHLTPLKNRGSMTGFHESQFGASLVSGESRLNREPAQGPVITDQEVAAMILAGNTTAGDLDPPSLEMDDPRVVFKEDHYSANLAYEENEASQERAAASGPTVALEALKKKALEQQQTLKEPHQATSSQDPVLNPAENFTQENFSEIMEDDCVDGTHVKAVFEIEDQSEISSLAEARVVQNISKGEIQTVLGYGKIPSFIVPFDGRTGGGYPANGVPKHYQEKVDGSNITRSQSYVLYSSPLAQGPLSMMNNKAVAQRYLQSRSGRLYNAKGTLFRLLRDTAQPVESTEPDGGSTKTVEKPEKNQADTAPSSRTADLAVLTEEEKAFPTGAQIAEECTNAKYQLEGEKTVRRGQKVAMRITATWMMEPTCIPVDSNRDWLTKLTSADAHSSGVDEFIGIVAGQMSFHSRHWKERLLENGQRVFQTTSPGKSYSQYSYSTGSGRDIAGTWSLKIGGRVVIGFLCGCCTRLSLAEAAKMASPPTEDAYNAAIAGRKAAIQLVDDLSVGAPKGAKMLCPTMDPPTTAGTWRLARTKKGEPKHWEFIIWPGYEMEFVEEGQERGFRQCVRVTNGKEMAVETLIAIQGTCSFIVTNFAELQTRFKAFCNEQKPVVVPRSKAFVGNRYPRGLMTPSWIENEHLIQRVHGKNWAKHFEKMVFSMEADAPVFWLEGSKNGKLAQKYLVSDYDSTIEEVEILGRVDTSGRFIRMGEEENYQPGSSPQLNPLLCGGHRMAKKTKAKRHASSKKRYSTAEFSSSETL